MEDESVIDMDWITTDFVSSAGFNTIRRMREGYENIQAGDTVRLSLRAEVGADPHMVETLTVRSVCHGFGLDICNAFGHNNHGFALIEGEVLESDMADMIDSMEAIYGPLEGEFIAVTFL